MMRGISLCTLNNILCINLTISPILADTIYTRVGLFTYGCSDVFEPSYAQKNAAARKSITIRHEENFISCKELLVILQKSLEQPLFDTFC